MIERAIKSVISQTYPVCELLLIDDNEPDSEFSNVIRSHINAFPLVKYISLGGNSGVGTARNKAVEVAEGDYIAYLDDDDEWFPDKIREQISILEKHPHAGIVFGLGLKWNDDTQSEEGLTWSSTVFRESPTFNEMLAHDRIGSASHPLISKSAMKEVGGFRAKQEMPAVEDYELWIRIIQKYKGYGINEALYRKHMNNQEHISRNHSRTFEGYRYIYQEFKQDYLKDSYARKCIVWNVVREGVKSKRPAVIPYVFQWLILKIQG